MPLKARITLLMALGACTPQRPDGAYTPIYRDPATTCMEGFTCEDPDAGEDVDPGDDVGDDDVMPDPEMDSGTQPTDPDAGPVIVDPSDPLAGLVSRYFMRVDYYSTADKTDTATGARLTLKNRVSNLFLTELKLVDGQLRSSEQLCFQSSAHQCQSGCENWKTAYADGLPGEYKKLKPLERTFAVGEDGTLQVAAEGALLALGYTEPAPTEQNLPQSYTDARAWKLGSAEDRLRGVATVLTGTLKASLVSLPLNCEVDSAQLFATAFSGKLPSKTAAELAKRIFEVDATGSGASVLQAVGSPQAQFCDPKKLRDNSAGDGNERAFVRFKPTTASSCPTSISAYENTSFKINEQIDPPTPTDPK